MAKSFFQWKDVPAFSDWVAVRLGEYSREYPEVDENPNKTPRKGIAPGQEYPFSFVKYAAACKCVLIGTPKIKWKKVQLDHILWALAPWGVTPAVLRVWRTEERFQAVTSELRQDFASYYVNALYDPSHPVRNKERLMKESPFYSKELQEEINQYLLIMHSEIKPPRDPQRYFLHALINLNFLSDPHKAGNEDVDNWLPPLPGNWLSPSEIKEDKIKAAKLSNLNFLGWLLRGEITNMQKKKNSLKIDDIHLGIDRLIELAKQGI